jgi:hypothetical protein
MFYVQCLLQYHCGGRSYVKVYWLPEQYAERKKKMKLFRYGEWEPNWRVLEAYPGYKASDKIVESQAWDYMSQRDIVEV